MPSMLRMLSLFALALMLTACVETTAKPTESTAQNTAMPSDAIAAKLSGKKLVRENGSGFFDVNSDGSLVGELRGDDFIGTWAIRNGQWCRTFEKPARFAGTACQNITLNDDGTVTIEGTNGPVTFTIE